MSINDQTLLKIDDAITRLLDGEQLVSLTITDPDGQVNKTEYTPTTIKDLLTLKRHYESINTSTMNTYEVEIKP